MQAIHTKFIAPTNTRGPRIKATAQAGSITIAWDHALDIRGNHEAAMWALIAKLDWSGCATVGGALEDGSWAHVLVPPRVRALYDSKKVESHNEDGVWGHVLGPQR